MKTLLILSSFLVVAFSCSDSGGETRVYEKGYKCEAVRNDVTVHINVYEKIEEDDRKSEYGTPLGTSVKNNGQQVSCWVNHGSDKYIGFMSQETSDWVGSCEVVAEDVNYQIEFDYGTLTSEFIISAPDQETESMNSECERFEKLIDSYT